ncbi:unnamed protein product [Ostreobium quekettii]|uniref:BAH domain-containing protein n=1 Tax=Ostreobium quekettii TaxID=121088 RepID=A0A8S1JBC9_9CHLO|nr:unnamed protein product [Ostreobium quekettii]
MDSEESDLSTEDDEVFSYDQNCQPRKVRIIGTFSQKKERIDKYTVTRCKTVEIKDPFTNRNGGKPWRKVFEGSTVLIHGEDTLPMMALVHKLYKIDSGTRDGRQVDALLKVTWLYRDKEVKSTNKKPSSCTAGAILNRKKESESVREVFYTAHSDTVLAHHIIHPCLVHFQRSNDPLPFQDVQIGQNSLKKHMKGFVCRRFYDTSGKKCYFLDAVADDVRAIKFEDHLVLEVQDLLKATRRQIDAWHAHNPRWYLNERPGSAAGRLGEVQEGGTDGGVPFGNDVANQSAVAEGNSEDRQQQHRPFDAVKGSTNRKRQWVGDQQGAMPDWKSQKTDVKHTPWRRLDRTVSDPVIPELKANTSNLQRQMSLDAVKITWEPNLQSYHSQPSGSVPLHDGHTARHSTGPSKEAKPKTDTKTPQASVSLQVSSREDDESDDDIPLSQRYKQQTCKAELQIAKRAKTANTPANPDLYIRRNGDRFDVKIPKAFTHGGETRTELVFSGSFTSRDKAEKVCIAAMHMDHADLKDYVKANAAEFGADPRTGRPPVEPAVPLTVIPKRENKSCGSKRTEVLHETPREVEKQLRRQATPVSEITPTSPVQGPTPFSCPPQPDTAEVEHSPRQGRTENNIKQEMPSGKRGVTMPTSQVLAGELAQPHSLQEDLQIALGADTPCRLSSAEEGAMVVRAYDDSLLQRYPMVTYKTAEGEVKRGRLIPEEDVAALKAVDQRACDSSEVLGADCKDAALSVEPRPTGTPVSEPDDGPPQAVDSEQNILGSEALTEAVEGVPKAEDKQEGSPVAGNELNMRSFKELQGKVDIFLEGRANEDTEGDLIGYSFRDCLICMEHRFAEFTEFTAGFLERAVHRGLWDLFLSDVDKGARTALVLKVDTDSGECYIMFSIRQSDRSDRTDNCRHTLFATEWVLAWPQVNLKDSIEELQQQENSGGNAGYCPSGQGAYLEDGSGAIIGGCIGMGHFDMWLIVDALVQLGYLEEPNVLSGSTLTAGMCKDVGKTSKDGAGDESETSDEEIEEIDIG